jgi:hypothetical protein
MRAAFGCAAAGWYSVWGHKHFRGPAVRFDSLDGPSDLAVAGQRRSGPKGRSRGGSGSRRGRRAEETAVIIVQCGSDGRTYSSKPRGYVPEARRDNSERSRKPRLSRSTKSRGSEMIASNRALRCCECDPLMARTAEIFLCRITLAFPRRMFLLVQNAFRHAAFCRLSPGGAKLPLCVVLAAPSAPDLKS